MGVTINDLPAELIQQIHILAHNPFFPQTSRTIFHSLHSPSAYYTATYLLSLYLEYGPNEILVRALRHPVCTLQVAQALRRIWDRRRGYVEPDPARTRTRTLPRSGSITGTTTLNTSTSTSASASASSSGNKARSRVLASATGYTSETLSTDVWADPDPSRSRSRSRSRSPTPSAAAPVTSPPLACSELPRRLFRDPPQSLRDHSKAAPIHPLIHYLFTTYSPSANSHKGYPLFRAILTSNYDLVSFLLSHGADPGLRDCFALDIAISMKDLRMVKLLVERDSLSASTSAPNMKKHAITSSNSSSSLGAIAPQTPSPAKNATSGVGAGKKVKLGDRITITQRMVERAVEKGSKEIINYFVYEKKVMPPLQSIMKLGKPNPLPNRKKSRPARK